MSVGELDRCFLLSLLTGVSKNAKHLQVDMDKDSVFSSNVSWIFGCNLGLICWEAIFVWRWHGRLENIMFINMNFRYYTYQFTNKSNKSINPDRGLRSNMSCCRFLDSEPQGTMEGAKHRSPSFPWFFGMKQLLNSPIHSEYVLWTTCSPFN